LHRWIWWTRRLGTIMYLFAQMDMVDKTTWYHYVCLSSLA